MCLSHWTEEDHQRVNNASEFRQLAEIGLVVMSRMPQPISQVCGPLSTGGRGSFAENAKLFHVAIKALRERGHNVFDQMIFETAIRRIVLSWNGNGYCMPILTDFYEPLFRSGMVKKKCFLPDWQSSYGARWEREKAVELGIEIFDIPPDWLP